MPQILEHFYCLNFKLFEPKIIQTILLSSIFSLHFFIFGVFFSYPHYSIFLGENKEKINFFYLF
ncbi:hypothetical protein COT99_03245 [Candidatus Falkowbacteria bacterium CG10_big_fil_rev_8_21_14_0_10_43_10]|uniref:Uncharacterized protein n=1 Tax=Candidatus Falkowbacteria bacterium CG10_big_fil_rev_8_21_14_0_10_43_10 TaxID=1974567 RepID=A0A2H0V1J6_9BACT|nr:MAG: hypothetical protein COT99_03245 [Candidatus Falkowbacteria bacterium CG10_big_fil_rev_8_21_14_0_10_43_10]